jgi:hypothetical protein
MSIVFPPSFSRPGIAILCLHFLVHVDDRPKIVQRRRLLEIDFRKCLDISHLRLLISNFIPQFKERNSNMGSIHNLLNPVNTPSPRRFTSPQASGMARTDEEEHDDVSKLETETGGGVPLLDPLRARNDDNGVHSQTNKIVTEVKQIQTTRMDIDMTNIEEGQEGSGQNGELLTVPGRPASGPSEGKDKGDSSRRTSSSSLADILNPTDEPPVAQNNSPEQPTAKTVAPESSKSDPLPSAIMQANSPPRAQTPPLPIPMKSTSIEEPLMVTAVYHAITTEEDMIVDIVGLAEEVAPLDAEQTSTVAETNGSTSAQPNGHPMQRSRSNDSQATISDIDETSTNIPVAERRHMSPSPSSKKRKFTPESSSDQPLQKDVNVQETEATPKYTEVQAQISVEKPQAAARAIKKPKKAPIKKPEAARKKIANGQRKPAKPKRKEKSMSVGIDEVSPNDAEANLLEYTHSINSTIQHHAFSCLILILR